MNSFAVSREVLTTSLYANASRRILADVTRIPCHVVVAKPQVQGRMRIVLFFCCHA